MKKTLTRIYVKKFSMYATVLARIKSAPTPSALVCTQHRSCIISSLSYLLSGMSTDVLRKFNFETIFPPKI